MQRILKDPDLPSEPRAFSSPRAPERVLALWPEAATCCAPVRPTRLRRERGSVVVVLPTAPVPQRQTGARVRRVIGMDIHRTFAEVVIWEAGQSKTN